MIKFKGNIEDFWTQDLNNFLFPQRYSAGQREEFHKNYSLNTNDLLQAFDQEVPNFERFKQLARSEKSTVSWTCLEPGQSIPVHTDSFYKLRNQYHVEIENCARYLIFLQDWQLGHLVDFEDVPPITKWKKGDVWIFDHKSYHCAANASNVNFITCQVNTVVNIDK